MAMLVCMDMCSCMVTVAIVILSYKLVQLHPLASYGPPAGVLHHPCYTECWVLHELN